MDQTPANPVLPPEVARELLEKLNMEKPDTTSIEPNLEESDLGKGTFKSLYYGSVIAKFELEKPKLVDVIAACKQRLVAGEDAADVRKTVLLEVQRARLPHNYVRFDEKYNVKEWRNGKAADRIMKCLADGESVDDVLSCVFGHVYGILEAEAETKSETETDNTPSASDTPVDSTQADDKTLPAESTDVPVTTANPDESTSGDEPEDHTSSAPVIGELFSEREYAQIHPDEEPMSIFGSGVREQDAVEPKVVEADTSLESWIDHLADEFSRKVVQVRIGDTMVFVPAADSVRLRQANNGTWCLTYDSVLGKEHNRYKGFGETAFQSQFYQRVANQDTAAATDPSDVEGIARLIVDSVVLRNDRPISYPLMTNCRSTLRDSADDESNDGSREEILADLARLVGKDPSQNRPAVFRDVSFLLYELLSGKKSAELKELYRQKQVAVQVQNERKAIAKQRSEESTNLTQLPPPPDSAGLTISRERKLEAASAFMDVLLRDCKTREEAESMRAQIIGATKEFLSNS